MPTISLTQAAIERLKAPSKGRVDYWDKNQPGFGLRITHNGHKSWTVVYRLKGSSKLERVTLGSVADIPKVDKAREMARDIRQRVAQGEDPKATVVVPEIRTVGAIVTLFMQRYMRAKGRAERYITETQRIFDKDVLPKLGERDIKSIARGDVIDLLDGIVDDGRPVQANRVLAAIRKLLNWSLDRGYIDTSPVVRMSAPSTENDRERVLSPDELRLVWLGAEKLGYPYGPMTQLLILTLQRRNEVAEATWDEFGDVNDLLWRIPGERTKNGFPNDVPLSAAAADIIKQLPKWVAGKEAPAGNDILPFLFVGERRKAVSGFANAKQRLDEKIMEIQRSEAVNRGDDPEVVKALPHWTFHDLRRTGDTLMAEGLGIAPHVIEAIINHVSGTIRGVARVYNRATFAKPKRLALDAWGGYVKGLMERAVSNVHKLAIPK
jgi:integrase